MARITSYNVCYTKLLRKKSLNEIKDVLHEMGLSLGMMVEGFSPERFTPPRQED